MSAEQKLRDVQAGLCPWCGDRLTLTASSNPDSGGEYCVRHQTYHKLKLTDTGLTLVSSRTRP